MDGINHGLELQQNMINDADIGNKICNAAATAESLFPQQSKQNNSGSPVETSNLFSQNRPDFNHSSDEVDSNPILLEKQEDRLHNLVPNLLSSSCQDMSKSVLALECGAPPKQERHAQCHSRKMNKNNILASFRNPSITNDEMSSFFTLTSQVPLSPVPVNTNTGSGNCCQRHTRQNSYFSFSEENLQYVSSVSADKEHNQLGLPSAIAIDSDSRCRSSSLSSVEPGRVDYSDLQFKQQDRSRATTIGSSSLSAFERSTRLQNLRQQRPLRRRAAQAISPLARTPFSSPERRSADRFTRLTNDSTSQSIVAPDVSSRVTDTEILMCNSFNLSGETKAYQTMRNYCDGQQSSPTNVNTYAQGIEDSILVDYPRSITINDVTGSVLDFAPLKRSDGPLTVVTTSSNIEPLDCPSRDTVADGTTTTIDLYPSPPVCDGRLTKDHSLNENEEHCFKNASTLVDLNHTCAGVTLFDEEKYKVRQEIILHVAKHQSLETTSLRRQPHIGSDAPDCLNTHVLEPPFSISKLPPSGTSNETKIIAGPLNTSRVDGRSDHDSSNPPVPSLHSAADPVSQSQKAASAHDFCGISCLTADNKASKSSVPCVGAENVNKLKSNTETLQNQQKQTSSPVKVQQFHLTPATPCVHKETRIECLEKEHVYQVYRRIAPQCDHVRHKAWPRVTRFLKDLKPGSLVADIGCGSGRYLGVNNQIVKFGSDTCGPFLEQARSQGYEVAAANNFALPFRDASFDAVISIGVIHHFASLERRVKALDELARILSPGGKLMVYVWAFEQTHRKFDSQDVLIPWVRPEGKGLPRRNTVCCLTDQDVVDKPAAANGTDQPNLQHKHPGTQSDCRSTERGSNNLYSHAVRRRSRSVGDDPESPEPKQNQCEATQKKTRQFGVFDKRASSSTLSVLLGSKQGKMNSQTSREKSLDDGKSEKGTFSPLENAQLAKLPNQLVSECRKLGRFLRSLSSKSWSSSCEESMEQMENDAFEQNVEKVNECDVSLGVEPETSEMKVKIDESSNDLEETNRYVGKCTEAGEERNTTKDYVSQNKDIFSQSSYLGVCSPVQTKSCMQQLQRTIVLENINNIRSEIEDLKIHKLKSGTTIIEPEEVGCKRSQILQVPFIIASDLWNQSGSKCCKDNKLKTKVKRSRMSLENMNDCSNGGHSDGYATDAECSPYGGRTPVCPINGLENPESPSPSYGFHGKTQLQNSVETSYQSMNYNLQTHPASSFTENQDQSLNCPMTCCVPPVCTTSSFKNCDSKFNHSNNNPYDYTSPDAEAKLLEKPKSYLQVLTPVLISSSADESDGMSPGNLSPCSWYTGGGGTSGESDGPESMTIKQPLNVITLNKVCLGQGHSDGQMQLKKWVQSQQSQNFEIDSSNEDISVNVPQYPGRPCRNKQHNAASGVSNKRGNLPHIQVHALREGDTKTYKSDPNLPDASNSPLFVISAEPENSRGRAYSDISAMDNQRNCRYSDSVFSDTLRTPSIATPGLRTPNSGGCVSDYNTSTEVLFAPSDLAENNDWCFDTDSVFTPDNEKGNYVNKFVNNDQSVNNVDDSAIAGQTHKYLSEEGSPERQRKIQKSASDKGHPQISSCDSEYHQRFGRYKKIASTSKEKGNAPTDSLDCHAHRTIGFHPIRSVFSKIAGLFSHSERNDCDPLLSDPEKRRVSPEREVSVDIKISITKKETVLSTDDEDDMEEVRSNGETTSSTSLTLSWMSPSNQSSDSIEKTGDDSLLDAGCNAHKSQKCTYAGTPDTIEENHLHCVNIHPQNNKRAKIPKDMTSQNASSKASAEQSYNGIDAVEGTNFDNKLVTEREEKSRVGRSILQSLAEKWSQLFSSDHVLKNVNSKDDNDPSSLLLRPEIGEELYFGDLNTGGSSNSNPSGAKRPKTLDFSRKRRKLRGQRKISGEKNSILSFGKQQGLRKDKIIQKPEPELRLSLAAALDLLSEGASEESFAERLDGPALLVFAEMRRLNFFVREFPKSSLDKSDGFVKGHAKKDEATASSRMTEEEILPMTSKDVSMNKTHISAASCEAKQQTDTKLFQNTGRKMKSYGQRRRFSDSTATKRERRAVSMVHLKPPNWTFGYDVPHVPHEDEKTQAAGTAEKDIRIDTQTKEENQLIKDCSTQKVEKLLANSSNSQHSSTSNFSDKIHPNHQCSDPRIMSENRGTAVSRLCDNVIFYPANNILTATLNLKECNNSEVVKTSLAFSTSESGQSHQTGETNLIKSSNISMKQTKCPEKSQIPRKYLENDFENLETASAKTPIMKDKRLQFETAINLKESEGKSSAVQQQKFVTENQHTSHSIGSHSERPALSKQVKSEDASGEDNSLSRYYHVFKQGELDGLVKEYVPALSLIDTFYDHSNWCIIAHKN